MKHIIFGALLSLTIFAASSCSNTPVVPEEPQTISVQTNNDPFLVQPEPIKERPKKDSVRKDTTDKRKDTLKPRPTIFNDLLKSLNLTLEQKSIVEKLLEEHRSCVDNCVKPLKAAEAEILANARIRETEIKKALENGKITKAQAREKLNALRLSVNKSLKELPIRAKVQECIKSCDDAFINSLERILTERQRIILKTWVESRKKRTNSEKKDTTDAKRRG